MSSPQSFLIPDQRTLTRHHKRPTYVRLTPKKRSTSSLLFVVMASVVLSLMSVALLIFMMFSLGIGNAIAATGAALVPLGLVLIGVKWINRWTPEPRSAMSFAFAWGAIAATFTALVVGSVAQSLVTMVSNEPSSTEFFGAVIQAPLVEETTKCLGLVILLIFGRRFIAGPVDGFVYAALIAGGFAFTENILYFGTSLNDYAQTGLPETFWGTFFLRGIMSPFAHVSFTGMAGLAAGLAAERRWLPLYFTLFPGGIGLGMMMHALWNGQSYYMPKPTSQDEAFSGFLGWYLFIEVPIFLVIFFIIFWLRLREKKILRTQLTEYGRAGWFTPPEVDMLVSGRGRRRAKRWAVKSGALALDAMQQFQTAAIELAIQRHSVIHGATNKKVENSEYELLTDLSSARRKLSALVMPIKPIN